MIHQKVTNVLLFLLLISLWLLAYLTVQVQLDLANHKGVSDRKTNQQNDLPPPELEPEKLKFVFPDKPTKIPGLFNPVRRKNGN